MRTFFLSHQRISQRAVRSSLEKQLDPRGPVASRGESVPVFLRKLWPLVTFQEGGVRTPFPLPLDLPLVNMYHKTKE